MSSHAVGAGPPVDPEAIREVEEAEEAAPRFGSAEALHHYLGGALAAERGDHADAIAQLREALVFDEHALHARVRLALEYFHSGQTERAESALREAVAQRPSSAEAHAALGQILLESDRPLEAARELERAVALAPARPRGDWRALAQAWQRLGNEPRLEAALDGWAKHVPGELGWRDYGEALLDHGELQKAERYLTRALTFAPEDPAALAALGRLADLRDDDAAALSFYERSVRSDPDDGGVLVELGQHYLRRARLAPEPAADRALARACFDSVVASAQDEAPARAEVGLAYAQAHLFEEAFSELSAAVSAEPDAPRWRYYRGLVELELGAASGAAVDLGAIPFGDELWVDAQTKLGVALMRLNRHAEAETKLEADLDRMPDEPRLTLALALVREEAGKPQAAVRLLERAVERRGPAPDLVVALGGAYELVGRGSDALSTLRWALASKPNDSTLLFALGETLGRLGRQAEALEAMRRVVNVDPRNPEALNFIGFALAQRGERLPEAEKLVRRALELEPDSGLIADSLGWVYFKEGRFALAVETLDRAVRAAPNEPLILEHLGDACERNGDRARAAESYAKALRALGPTREGASSGVETSSEAGMRDSLAAKLHDLENRTASAVLR
ncbi:MAG: tetratricopeptide repeat protein [Deltaproteobacteria bacterium]